MTVRIVNADDQALVRAGLRKIFDADPELEILGEAADGLAAVDVVRRASARTSSSWTYACRSWTVSRQRAA